MTNSSEQTTAESISSYESSTGRISLAKIVLIVWKGKWLCLGLAALVGVAAWAYSLTLTDQYKAELTFISQTGGSASSSQIAGLAQLAGVSLSSGSSSGATLQVRTILASRALRERVVDKLRLDEQLFPEGKRPTDARRAATDRLKAAMKVSAGKNDESILEVELPDAELAQEVAQQIIAELEQYLLDYNVERARKSSQVLERQIRDQSERVRKAQEAQAVFQVKYRALNPDSQMSTNYQIINGLYSQKVQLDVELKMAQERYQGDNTRIQELKLKIQSLESQIEEAQRSGGLMGIGFADAPERYIEYQNLTRDVEIAQKIFLGLLSSFEQANLASADTRVAIQVIDSPLLPKSRSGPNRGQIVAVAVLAGLFLGILALFMRELAAPTLGQIRALASGSPRTKKGSQD